MIHNNNFFDQSEFKALLVALRDNSPDITIVCCTNLTIQQLRQLANALYHNDQVIQIGGRALYSAYAYNTCDWPEADTLLTSIHAIVDQNYSRAQISVIEYDQPEPA